MTKGFLLFDFVPGFHKGVREKRHTPYTSLCSAGKEKQIFSFLPEISPMSFTNLDAFNMWPPNFTIATKYTAKRR